jgi:hypothetical protein
MEKIPMETIDRLFSCMTSFYGSRWTSLFDNWLPEKMAKVQWQSALQGLNHEEIRGVLVLLRQAAKNPDALPPHCVEFHSYAKGTSRPHIAVPQNQAVRADPEIARRALDEINEKLHYKKPPGSSIWNVEKFVPRN